MRRCPTPKGASSSSGLKRSPRQAPESRPERFVERAMTSNALSAPLADGPGRGHHRVAGAAPPFVVRAKLVQLAESRGCSSADASLVSSVERDHSFDLGGGQAASRIAAMRPRRQAASAPNFHPWSISVVDPAICRLGGRSEGHRRASLPVSPTPLSRRRSMKECRPAPLCVIGPGSPPRAVQFEHQPRAPHSVSTYPDELLPPSVPVMARNDPAVTVPFSVDGNVLARAANCTCRTSAGEGAHRLAVRATLEQEPPGGDPLPKWRSSVVRLRASTGVTCSPLRSHSCTSAVLAALDLVRTMHRARMTALAANDCISAEKNFPRSDPRSDQCQSRYEVFISPTTTPGLHLRSAWRAEPAPRMLQRSE